MGAGTWEALEPPAPAPLGFTAPLKLCPQVAPGTQAGGSCPMQASSNRPSSPGRASQRPTAVCAHPPQALPSFSPVTGLRPALQLEVFTISPAPLYLLKPCPTPISCTPDWVLLSDFQRVLTNAPGFPPKPLRSDGRGCTSGDLRGQGGGRGEVGTSVMKIREGRRGKSEVLLKGFCQPGHSFLLCSPPPLFPRFLVTTVLSF